MLALLGLHTCTHRTSRAWMEFHSMTNPESSLLLCPLCFLRRCCGPLSSPHVEAAQFHVVENQGPLTAVLLPLLLVLLVHLCCPLSLICVHLLQCGCLSMADCQRGARRLHGKPSIWAQQHTHTHNSRATCCKSSIKRHWFNSKLCLSRVADSSVYTGGSTQVVVVVGLYDAESALAVQGAEREDMDSFYRSHRIGGGGKVGSEWDAGCMAWQSSAGASRS